MNRISVLHCIHWPKSGITSLLKYMIPLFDQSKIITHVILFEDDDEAISEFSEICSSVHTLSFSQSRIKGLSKYLSLLHSLNPLILHTHSFQPGLWGRLFVTKARTKHVCTLHSVYPYFSSPDYRSRLKRKLEAFSLKHSDATIICVSEAVRRSVSSVYQFARPQVIENGIPVDIFSQRQQPLSKTTEGKTFISLGRLHYEKGFDILLYAFARVLEVERDVKLYLVGEGEERAKLEKIVVGLGISDHVFFTGFQCEPFQYFDRADIYISSSRYEGFPLSIAEAMLWGLPVISTQVGGVTTMLYHGVTGWLVPPENPEALSAAMLFLLRNKEVRDGIGERGKRFIVKNADIKKTARLYEQLYRSLINLQRN